MCACAYERRRSINWQRTSYWAGVCTGVSPVSVRSHVGIVQHACWGCEPVVSVNMHGYMCFWAKNRVYAFVVCDAASRKRDVGVRASACLWSLSWTLRSHPLPMARTMGYNRFPCACCWPPQLLYPPFPIIPSYGRAGWGRSSCRGDGA